MTSEEMSARRKTTGVMIKKAVVKSNFLMGKL
jgi:hypothetical protein